MRIYTTASSSSNVCIINFEQIWPTTGLLPINKKIFSFRTTTLRRWIPNPGVPCSKPLGGSKVDSAFHPPEVDRMSTRNFWELSGKK